MDKRAVAFLEKGQENVTMFVCLLTTIPEEMLSRPTEFRGDQLEVKELNDVSCERELEK